MLSKTTVAATLLAALLLLNPLSITAQESDPASVVQNWHDAAHAGDIDAALEYMADDATVELVPPPPAMDGTLEGTEEIRGWYEQQVAANAESEILDVQTDGNQVTIRETYIDDTLRGMGFEEPVELDVTFTVEDGLIQSYTAAMTEESMARMPAPPSTMPETGTTSSSPLAALVLLAGLTLLGLGWALSRKRVHEASEHV